MRPMNWEKPIGVATAWLWLAGFAAMPAPAATFVSFQEGDLRVGGDKATVGASGALVNAGYGMGATRIRSDQPDTAADNQQLLVGNNNAPTFRTLLAFDLSHLETLIAGNPARIDSAALLLTHDSAGTGGSSVQAIHWTLPFNEATATWNDPHGLGTNAGGFIGAQLRERGCVGTSASPTRESWGSPAGFWADGSAGPDLLVEAVRGALTNAHKTLYLLVKRKSESSTAYFSRYQHDGAATVDYRPELIVGVDSLNPGNWLATYGFNENDHNHPSLAAVAAATVLDTNRLAAANAVAGAGLGLFAPGGSGGEHGYGTAAYVSAPAGFYARSSVTAGSLAGALSGADFVSFTLAPRLGYVLEVQGFSAWMKLQAASNLTGSVVVRSSLDGFSSYLASLTVAGNGSTTVFTLLSNSFPNPGGQALVNPIEFRFYLFDDTDSTADILRLDDVTFYGRAGDLPPGAQVVALEVGDGVATESGGDPASFLLRRFGDAGGPLTVYYQVSGSATNGGDYETLSGEARFEPGQSNLVIQINPLDDQRAEPEETIKINLQPNAAYWISGAPAAEIRLLDDLDPPEFEVTVKAAVALENRPQPEIVFAVARRLGNTNSAVEVVFEFAGAATFGVDYTPSATNRLAFAPGQVSVDIRLSPLDDQEEEGAETVLLRLLPGTGYSVGNAAEASATLFDDEGLLPGSLLVEAESFADLGGWVVDQQFVDLMGSVYLLAHGKGKPVADARTVVQFPVAGAYHLWARTKDWTAPLTNHPGAFQVWVDGAPAADTFGTVGQGWVWQYGGLVLVANLTAELRLRDLTGFDGRCDALFFTTDPVFTPPDHPSELAAWRRMQSGLPEIPPDAGEFDLVVVGGGIAGSSASLAAARQGLRVALIHDRPTTGGNASQDVRVHTLGNDMGGITAEINTPDYLIGSAHFIQSDQQRMQTLRAETNISLFTEWRAFAVQTNGARLTAVDAKHIRTGEERRFRAPLFVDSTGDAWIGYWAGALYRQGREARAEFNESLAPTNADAMTMGSTLSWNSRDTGALAPFPEVPWAMDVAKDYSATRGDWWWEYGLNRDTIYDAEEIRDYLLRAIYGSFSNAKQLPANANRELDWVAYVAGKRESRRLVGDYILAEADVRNHPVFPDAVVTEGREIDIHYTKAGNYDWQTYAQFTSIADYWIPFRCLYSTNIDNLMMAGRCLSATHVGLGSPRVMNTGGQMGVAVGNAAALCKKYGVTPRLVARRHAAELQALIGILQYFDTPTNTVVIVDNADAARVETEGTWTLSTSGTAYFGPNYAHDGNAGKGAAVFTFRPDLPLRNDYRVYIRWNASGNRATNTPVEVVHRQGANTFFLDQTQNGSQWILLGVFPFDLGNAGCVRLRNQGTTGYVVADAVAWVAAFPLDTRFSGYAWPDDDGDGVCNYLEHVNGTNPRDPLSYLKASLGAAGGVAAVRFVGLPGQSYTIQYRDSLTTGGWQKLADVAPAAATREIEVADPQLSIRSHRYYRLVSPKLP